MNTKEQNRSQKPAPTGELVGVDVPRIVRELPNDATCAECGKTAAESACSEKLTDIGATERNFIEHWSKWRDGKHFILGSEPQETFPLDRRGHKWEVCGDCGCPRWDLPNDQVELPPKGSSESKKERPGG